MSENGLWWKLYTTVLSDMPLMNLPNADFGIWTKLGVLIKKEGSNGSVTLHAPATFAKMLFQAVTFSTLLEALRALPNVTVQEVQKDVTYVVTMRHWHASQKDNSRDRVARYRARKKAEQMYKPEAEVSVTDVTGEPAVTEAQNGNVTKCYSSSSSSYTNTITPNTTTPGEAEHVETKQPQDTNIKAETRKAARAVIEYLNAKTGKRFTLTDYYEGKIKARLKEGHTVDDFKYVIDVKTEEWQNTDSEQYLRPDTLFSGKFQAYRQQRRLVTGGNGLHGPGPKAELSYGQKKALDWKTLTREQFIAKYPESAKSYVPYNPGASKKASETAKIGPQRNDSQPERETVSAGPKNTAQAKLQ